MLFGGVNPAEGAADAGKAGALDMDVEILGGTVPYKCWYLYA